MSVTNAGDAPPSWFADAVEEARAQDAWDEMHKDPLKFLAILAAKHGYAVVKNEPEGESVTAAWESVNESSDLTWFEAKTACCAMIEAGRIK